MTLFDQPARCQFVCGQEATDGPWCREHRPDPETVGNEEGIGPSVTGAPETSRNAALQNAPRRGFQREIVFHAHWLHRETGLTDQECVRVTGLPLDSVQPRRWELDAEHGDFVYDSGERRPTNLGNPSVVWKLTGKGRTTGWSMYHENGQS